MHPVSTQNRSYVIRLATDLPNDLTDIISTYATSDFSLVLEDFDGDYDGTVLYNQKNNAILKTMKEALMSDECDPKFKRHIFGNFPGLYRWGLRQMLNEIIEEGHRINLDNCDLSGCDLSRLNLDHMTARGASFVRTNLVFAELNKADLTGAIFCDVDASFSKWNGATLIATQWQRVGLIAAEFIKANVTDAQFSKVEFLVTDVSELITNDALLNQFIQQHRSKHLFLSALTGTKISARYSSGTGVQKDSTQAIRMNLPNCQRSLETAVGSNMTARAAEFVWDR